MAGKTPYQRFMSKELKGKMKGKTKAQRQAIFKAAVAKWKRTGGKKTKTKTKSSRSNKIRRTTKKPTKKPTNSGGRRMGKGGFNLSKIYKLARMGALALPAATTVMNQSLSGTEKLYKISQDYTGYNPYDGSFKMERLLQGWLPFIAASVVTYGVPKLTSILRGI